MDVILAPRAHPEPTCTILAFAVHHGSLGWLSYRAGAAEIQDCPQAARQASGGTVVGQGAPGERKWVGAGEQVRVGGRGESTSKKPQTALPWPGLNWETAGELGPSLGRGPPHCTWPQVWSSLNPGSLHGPSSAQNRQTSLLVSVITSRGECCMVTLPQRKA